MSGSSLSDSSGRGGLYGFALRYPERARRVAVLLLALGQTIGWAGLYYVFASLLLSWERSLGWAKAEITIALTIALLVSAASSPLAGRGIDAGRARPMMTIGMIAGALGIASLSLVQSRLAFMIIWGLVGAAQATCLYDACFAFLTRTLGPDAKRAITLVTLAAGFASTIAFPSGALLQATIGWRGAVIVFGLVVAGIGAPLIYSGTTLLECCPVPVPAATRRRERKSVVRTVTRQPAFRLLIIAFPLVALTEGLILTHIVPILVERGVGDAAAVSAASLFGPMQVAGRFVLMRTRQSRAVRVALLSFGGIMASTLLLRAVGYHSLLPFVFTGTFGAFFGLMSIIRPLIVAEQLGRTSFGVISGLISAPTLSAFALAPTVGSLLWSRGGYSVAITAATITAALGLLAIIALAIVDHRKEKMINPDYNERGGTT